MRKIRKWQNGKMEKGKSKLEGSEVEQITAVQRMW